MEFLTEITTTVPGGPLLASSSRIPTTRATAANALSDELTAR